MNGKIASDWTQLVAEFRRCCFLRSRGEVDQSKTILSEQLPTKIAAWSQSNSLEPSAKRAALEQMFRVEQQRVDDALMLQELASLQWQTELAPAFCKQVAQEVNRAISQQFIRFELRQLDPVKSGVAVSAQRTPKVPIDDIPAVIDLLLAQEKTAPNFEEDCLMGS